jgi:aryl carrier-like protein
MYASRLEHGIKTNEGQEVFRYILSATKLPQIVVSTSDMHAAMVEARNNTALKAMVEEATEPLWSHTLHPRPALETVYTAPRTEVERQIAETWGKVLGVAHIGVHDNYFDLGGDSVQAIQITAQTRRQGFHHTPQQLFEHQTVAELARVANQADPVLQPPAEVAPGPLSSSPFPLSGLNEQELEELEKFLEETGKSQPG